MPSLERPFIISAVIFTALALISPYSIPTSSLDSGESPEIFSSLGQSPSPTTSITTITATPLSIYPEHVSPSSRGERDPTTIWSYIESSSEAQLPVEDYNYGSPPLMRVINDCWPVASLLLESELAYQVEAFFIRLTLLVSCLPVLLVQLLLPGAYQILARKAEKAASRLGRPGYALKHTWHLAQQALYALVGTDPMSPQQRQVDLLDQRPLGIAEVFILYGLLAWFTQTLQPALLELNASRAHAAAIQDELDCLRSQHISMLQQEQQRHKYTARQLSDERAQRLAAETSRLQSLAQERNTRVHEVKQLQNQMAEIVSAARTRLLERCRKEGETREGKLKSDLLVAEKEILRLKASVVDLCAVRSESLSESRRIADSLIHQKAINQSLQERLELQDLERTKLEHFTTQLLSDNKSLKSDCEAKARTFSDCRLQLVKADTALKDACTSDTERRYKLDALLRDCKISSLMREAEQSQERQQSAEDELARSQERIEELVAKTNKLSEAASELKAQTDSSGGALEAAMEQHVRIVESNSSPLDVESQAEQETPSMDNANLEPSKITPGNGWHKIVGRSRASSCRNRLKQSLNERRPICKPAPSHCQDGSIIEAFREGSLQLRDIQHKRRRLRCEEDFKRRSEEADNRDKHLLEREQELARLEAKLQDKLSLHVSNPPSSDAHDHTAQPLASDKALKAEVDLGELLEKLALSPKDVEPVAVVEPTTDIMSADIDMTDISTHTVAAGGMVGIETASDMPDIEMTGIQFYTEMNIMSALPEVANDIRALAPIAIPGLSSPDMMEIAEPQAATVTLEFHNQILSQGNHQLKTLSMACDDLKNERDRTNSELQQLIAAHQDADLRMQDADQMYRDLQQRRRHAVDAAREYQLIVEQQQRKLAEFEASGVTKLDDAAYEDLLRQSGVPTRRRVVHFQDEVAQMEQIEDANNVRNAYFKLEKEHQNLEGLYAAVTLERDQLKSECDDLKSLLDLERRRRYRTLLPREDVNTQLGAATNTRSSSSQSPPSPRIVTSIEGTDGSRNNRVQRTRSAREGRERPSRDARMVPYRVQRRRPDMPETQRRRGAARQRRLASTLEREMSTAANDEPLLGPLFPHINEPQQIALDNWLAAVLNAGQDPPQDTRVDAVNDDLAAELAATQLG